MLGRFRIFHKFLATVICAAIGMIAIAGFGLSTLKQTLLEDRKAATQQMVEASLRIVEHYAKQAESGSLSEQAAKEQAKGALRAIRYGKGDYMFAFAMDGTVLILGTKPQIEGKSRIDEKDSDGIPYVRAMIERAAAGGGTVA